MRTVLKWVDKVSDRDKQEQGVYALCFNPDGTHLVAAAGQTVLVYDTITGNLIQPLKGHKDVVYCVDYSKDGKRFASGSADKNVIIWSSKLEGIVKYNHNDAVQCLEFNPVSAQLASCGSNELVLWSPQLKAVQKHKSTSRILCCSWTPDGQYIALGLSCGAVSVRSRSGEQKVRIERPGGEDTPVWAVAWSPIKEDNADILCITDWGQTMSFYNFNGKMVGKERSLGFEPLCVRYISKGEFILVSGCSKSCHLYTREGIKLGQIGESYQSWIWSCAAKPSASHIAVGCQDGKISMLQTVFTQVHGIYKEKYAYRENLTDVIIQNLLTDQKLRIKCRDLVKKLAIYKHRLAVQLGDRITIYELYNGDAGAMHYRLKEKLSTKVECSLLVVTSGHLILCHDRVLQCITFGGVHEREWETDASVRYIRVIGGPPNREGLLIGLANGQVLKIFIDNAFPVELVKLETAVKCLDISPSRKKLAVVSDKDQCLVYNLSDKELLFQEMNAKFVAWNTSCEDMLCFSGNNTLSIKASNFAEHQLKIQGFVVGFCSSKIFCFHQNKMSTIDVPLSAPMYQYLEKKLFREVYEIACLGVTECDWKTLAHSALDSFNLEIARKAFVRVKDLTYLELIHDIQTRQERGDRENDVFLAEILSYRGKFKEAGRMYAKAGRPEKALQMYTDLRMFDLGQEFLSAAAAAGGTDMDKKSLLRKKADWANNINEPRAAAQMYLSAGDTLKAVDIMIQHSWVDMLVEVGRKTSSGGTDAEVVLKRIAGALRSMGQLDLAAEMYRKLGADESLLEVHIEAGRWSEAIAALHDLPSQRAKVYLPYARYLAENDNFVQAQKAYHKAGHPEEAFRVVKHLTENAIIESRFNDASYYYWLLAKQALQLVSEGQQNMLQKYYEFEKYATIYYAYHSIQRYSEEPFTAYSLEDLFNIARYLMQETKVIQPPGVSQFALLLAVTKLARPLGAYKLARQVLSKIHTLRIPPKYQEYVDTLSLMVKGKPYHDNEDLLIMCYRCSSYNPLMTPHTARPNACTNCGQQFVHSFVTFEVLPLVEFYLEEGLSESEAIRLLESPSDDNDSSWTQNIDSNVQSMRLDESSPRPDPFSARIISYDGSSSDDLVPVIANRASLRALDISNVIICRYPKPLGVRFYRNLLPDVQVTACPHCHKIFHVDDYESSLLEKGFCPFCRVSADSNEDLESL
ncbi:intraflagellar transport protein Oseg1 isoform X2 [Rhodnius prolixus]